METNPTVAERELAKLDEIRTTTKPDMTASTITPDQLADWLATDPRSIERGP